MVKLSCLNSVSQWEHEQISNYPEIKNKAGCRAEGRDTFYSGKKYIVSEAIC